MQHALVRKWEQESRAKDLERVLDWGLVQDSVMVSGWALEAVLAMGSALVLDRALAPQLETVWVLVSDWESDQQLAMGSERASGWALEPVSAMGLGKVSLVPELAITSALALVKELVQTSETPLVMELVTTKGIH